MFCLPFLFFFFYLLIYFILDKCDLDITGKSTIITNIIVFACKTSLDNHKEIDLKAFAKEEYNYII